MTPQIKEMLIPVDYNRLLWIYKNIAFILTFKMHSSSELHNILDYLESLGVKLDAA